MATYDDEFGRLRYNLHIMGYEPILPIGAVPLVSALFTDLVKTTESLRNAKQQIVGFMEEKECWQLGAEPYKCECTRLLAECNALHKQAIAEREAGEKQLMELKCKMRDLCLDKQKLEQHCHIVEQQLKGLTALTQSKLNHKQVEKLYKPKTKKPFVSTVRAGIPATLHLDEQHEGNNASRCCKCQEVRVQRLKDNEFVAPEQHDKITELETKVLNMRDELQFHQRQLEAREREINRLQELLAKEGRPLSALSKECCYKEVSALTADVANLQREKNSCAQQVREYRDKMHEAMQRALELEQKNKRLMQDLDELKEAALEVENQANVEVQQCEHELSELRAQYERLIKEHKLDDRRGLQERLNEATQRETDLRSYNDRLHKKVHELKSKIKAMQANKCKTATESHCDEEKVNLRTQCDFFRNEYMRLLSKIGAEQGKDIDFLMSEIKRKDDELHRLRSELCQRACQHEAQSTEMCRTHTFVQACANAAGDHKECMHAHPECVQEVILRLEKQRDAAQHELLRAQTERDELRERINCLLKTHQTELVQRQVRIDELEKRLSILERDKRIWDEERMPCETQIVMLREEIMCLNKRLCALQEENSKLQQTQLQIRNLQEQKDLALHESQTKLSMLQAQLNSAESRNYKSDNKHEYVVKEAMGLRNEADNLRQTYLTLKQENDNLMSQLYAKTQLGHKLKTDLEDCCEKKIALDAQVKNLESQLFQLNVNRHERNAEWMENCTETKALRQQIAALKASRDETIAKNERLSSELAERQAEVALLSQKIRESNTEIERLKQQLRQYVHEVKKAEDLLLNKEKEREEMLEHYRNLSHDAVILECNNQSLETEAAEYKRQVCEMETEIDALKQQLNCRLQLIDELETKNAQLTADVNCLNNQLQEVHEEQRLLKIDLAAQKELCNKLDNERDKLNTELAELNELRYKLERDNEKLRLEMDKPDASVINREALEELLAKTRCELEEQIKLDSKLNQEVMRMREKNEYLLRELQLEREKRSQNETLVREYQEQNQELRLTLTEDRFRDARRREERFPLAAEVASKTRNKQNSGYNSDTL